MLHQLIGNIHSESVQCSTSRGARCFFFFSYTSFEKWLSVKWILSGLQQVLYSWLLLNKLYRIHYHTVSVKGRQMKYFHSTERVVLLKTTVFRSKTIYYVLTTCLDHLTVVSSKKRSKITSNSATCHSKLFHRCNFTSWQVIANDDWSASCYSFCSFFSFQ